MSCAGIDDTKTKLCIACSKWVDVDLSSCTCGHVFKQVKLINGKRFTEACLNDPSFQPTFQPTLQPTISTNVGRGCSNDPTSKMPMKSDPTWCSNDSTFHPASMLEGRFYQEVEDSIIEAKRKPRASTSIFCKEKITYMSGFTYEDIEDLPERKERKRKRRRPIHLLNSATNDKKNAKDVKAQGLSKITSGVYRRESNYSPIEQPLIHVLQEINNKITNQRKLWIDLDS